jgi:hypothetical protein
MELDMGVGRFRAVGRSGWLVPWAPVGVVCVAVQLAGVAPASAQRVSFSAPTNFAAGSLPNSIAVGNFNGDSDPDLAVANRGSNDVSILLNGIGAPAAPQLTDTDPRSPANDNQPRVKGTAATGSTVHLYKAATSADCTPANLAVTGTAAEFASPGLPVSVADNTTTSFRATVTDAAGIASDCSASSVDYLEDSAAPASVASSPTSSNSTSITVGYSASDGSGSGVKEVELWVRLPAAAGYSLAATDATPSSPSFTYTASAGDGNYRFYTRARDYAANYEDLPQSPPDSTTLVDTAAPAPPTFTATDPPSPANDRTPLVKGVAEAGSTVRLYKAPTAEDCTPPNLAASGRAAEFASPGLQASVPDNSSTSFRATATDAAGNPSACSPSSIIYVEHSGGASAGGARRALSAPPRVAADKAPRVKLGGPGRQRFGRRGQIYVLVECDEACKAIASGSASAKQARKVLRTRKVTRWLAAGKRAKLTLWFPRKGTRAIRRALGRHKRVSVRVIVTTSDRAGNASSAQRKIRLRR